ncbi:MAG: BACON domain-containing protein, partial [Bacteroidales bacterium]|nr:BACON domain-containing protein [Bacteroidales bacterium]
MKRFLSYLLAVAAAACTWSCGGNADPDEPEKPVAPATISLSNASFNVAQAGETVSLDITAPVRPVISGAPDWISVREGIYNSQTYVMSGVKLTVSANQTYETRSVTLTVSAGSASATFTVSQDGRSKPAEPDNKNL